MDINEIRQLSFEYAKGKGHVTIGPTFRGPSVKRLKPAETYAQWFARSLKKGKRAGYFRGPYQVKASGINRETRPVPEDYVYVRIPHRPPRPGLAPWED